MRSVEVYIDASGARYLGRFSNLKTLRVDNEFIEEFSRRLRVDNGGHPVELLPELQELAYSQAGSGNARDVFLSF